MITKFLIEDSMLSWQVRITVLLQAWSCYCYSPNSEKAPKNIQT